MKSHAKLKSAPAATTVKRIYFVDTPLRVNFPLYRQGGGVVEFSTVATVRLKTDTETEKRESK